MPEGVGADAAATKPRRNGWGQGGYQDPHGGAGTAGATVRPRTKPRAYSCGSRQLNESRKESEGDGEGHAERGNPNADKFLRR